MDSNSLQITNTIQLFKDYCDGKHYQSKITKGKDYIRIDISNLSERTIVNIYFTGTILIQGQQNSLKDEVEAFKKDIGNKLQSFDKPNLCQSKPCIINYDIMLAELRSKIKESLKISGVTIEIINRPKNDIEHRVKINRNGSGITLTQFTNGTLMIQGKTDALFHDYCDLVEKIANPSAKEVISRFISDDEKNLEIFSAKYTPTLISLAEENVKKNTGIVFDYFELYDKKWLIASECLCLANIPLPEFSPLVMPASKAFEGFAKNLLVDIKLVPSSYFKSIEANFSPLNDKKNPKRIHICKKDKHVDTMLKKIDLCLKTNRHFMMHSDTSSITKIDTYEEAKIKVNDIYKDIKEIFEYFNELFKII